MIDSIAQFRRSLTDHTAKFGALCTILLVALVAIAANTAGLTAATNAAQLATPNVSTPDVQATPFSGTSDAQATPTATKSTDWSNGVKPLWIFDTEDAQRAGNFPSAVNGVVAVYRSQTSILGVVDATTFKELWTFDGGYDGYLWGLSKESS